MIEMDESEHFPCAVDEATHAAVKHFYGGGAPGHEVSDKLLYTYDEIQQIGSDELKCVLDTILGGHRPGKLLKESGTA